MADARKREIRKPAVQGTAGIHVTGTQTFWSFVKVIKSDHFVERTDRPVDDRSIA